MAWKTGKICRVWIAWTSSRSKAERAAMGRHSAYWQEQAEKRIAIAVGPVMAADGPFGMAVVEVSDEAAARALADADPVIEAGLGFRFDVAPIPSIILRQA